MEKIKMIKTPRGEFKLKKEFSNSEQAVRENSFFFATAPRWQ